MELLQLVM